VIVKKKKDPASELTEEAWLTNYNTLVNKNKNNELSEKEMIMLSRCYYNKQKYRCKYHPHVEEKIKKYFLSVS
jgi:hypothetical protein